MISGVGKVVVPVDDQERAKEFWTTKVGFELRRDETFGDERWIEVSPPAGAPILALTQRAAGEGRPDVAGELPSSPVFFDCTDVERTHAELVARGVAFALPPVRRHFGWWSLFLDPDGNRYALSQWGAPARHPELARLGPLVGTWYSSGHTRDSVLGPGVPVTSRETFRWLDGGYFLVSTYETAFGGERVQTGVNYWSYDPDTRSFRIIFFSNNGPYSEEGNRYSGEVEDGALVFTGPARFRYELDDGGRIAVRPDGTIEVAWWLRGERGEWAPWMHNTFARAG